MFSESVGFTPGGLKLKALYAPGWGVGDSGVRMSIVGAHLIKTNARVAYFCTLVRPKRQNNAGWRGHFARPGQLSSCPRGLIVVFVIHACCPSPASCLLPLSFPLPGLHRLTGIRVPGCGFRRRLQPAPALMQMSGKFFNGFKWRAGLYLISYSSALFILILIGFKLNFEILHPWIFFQLRTT